MAHPQQIEFCLSVKQKLPEFFRNRLVVDIGSLDINGNNQYLFEDCLYFGIDLLSGKNVDFAVKGHELNLPDASVDVLVSTECFEHDQFYSLTLNNIVRMLKPGGLFLFSCATTGRPEHGTRRTTPADAPFIQEDGEWGDYYKNLDENDIRKVLDIESLFERHEFSINTETCDLYFWGIKKGELVERQDYSFQIKQSLRDAQIVNLNQVLTERDEQIVNLNQVLTERDGQIASLNQAVSERDSAVALVSLMKQSRSWRLTKPLRFAARLARGEFAVASLIQKEQHSNALIAIRRIKNGFAYIARGDISGFRSRLSFLRKESVIQNWQNADKNPERMTWAVLTPGHTLFVAQLIAERLSKNGWNCEVMTTPPKKFTHDFYIVLCPQTFDRLPPGEKRISYQMEQSVSSRWFTGKYFNILESSLAVLEYSLVNLEYLAKNGVAYPHVHYLPIGAMGTYGKHVDAGEKKHDVLFYGDSLSSPRRIRMIGALKEHFTVHVVNNLFGDDMIHVLKQSKVVVNIHYYENSLLEMPRIQECLSLGLQVVSESAQDQKDYPELGTAVRFFEQDSIDGMIAAVNQALECNNDAVARSVIDSEKRFAFMFDRFLVAMGFLPSSHVQSMQLPVPADADTFGLSLPETIKRRRVFETERPSECVIFDGVRHRLGWVGCGFSYAALARHALGHGMKSITVMEDDVVLPPDYTAALDIIKSYLKSKEGNWDVFSGVIASLHPDAEVLQVEEFLGKTFVTINRMTSTVFNVYSESALKMFSQWDPKNLDATTNTIDRYLENQKKIRVVVMLPFFVGHREEVHSTLWGFRNTQYCEMIASSQKLLEEKVRQVTTLVSA